MEAIMEQMKLKNINKSNWKKYRFDEIAKNISERVDPNKTELTTYIGLEHIDSENIHITRSGTPDDVNGTKLRFYKGDIIFGRRRAYQRKAGIAECDGFCSAHALVLRANYEVIDPKLFPFFLHSDSFMDRAVNISVGSLSPTINWGTLKFEEFLLPPPEEQEKLAELLWAMDEVIEREKETFGKASVTKKILLNDLSQPKRKSKEYRLKDIIKLHYGDPLKEQDRIDGDVLVVTSAGIQGTHNLFRTKGPGIVVGRKGNAGQVTWVEKDFWTTDTAYYVEVKDNYKNIPFKFWYYLLIASNLSKSVISTAVPGLNRDDALMSRVFIPDINEIYNCLERLQTLEKTQANIEDKITSSKALQKSLINQIF